MIYIKLTYPILLLTNLNIISFGCVLMVSNRERTKALSNVAIAAIIVLSTSGPLLAGIQAHARPVPVPYCRNHPFATVCHVRPVPVPYCRNHPFATVCHVRPVPVPYCRIHPFAPVCHPAVSYCRIHPFAPVCHPAVSYCRIHPFAPVCHPAVSYCRIHPFATVCHVRPVLFHVRWD
jgi:hypothetical protein